MPPSPTSYPILALMALSIWVSLAGAQEFDLTEGNWSGQEHQGSGARLLKPASFTGEDGALVLTGGNFIDVPGVSTENLPAEAFTIEAHVSLDPC